MLQLKRQNQYVRSDMKQWSNGNSNHILKTFPELSAMKCVLKCANEHHQPSKTPGYTLVPLLHHMKLNPFQTYLTGT